MDGHSSNVAIIIRVCNGNTLLSVYNYGFKFTFFHLRMDRIGYLCSVMGIEFLHDPDATYELTTDNVEKILAIHMRFRFVNIQY